MIKRVDGIRIGIVDVNLLLEDGSLPDQTDRDQQIRIFSSFLKVSHSFYHSKSKTILPFKQKRKSESHILLKHIIKTLENSSQFFVHLGIFRESFPNPNFCSLISVNEMQSFVSFPHFKFSFLQQSCLHHLNETQSPESRFPFPKKFKNTWQQIQVLSSPSSSSSSSLSSSLSSSSSWRSCSS